ncbi:MAG: DUF1592 domain-containing protein [Acidimicrobiia bacterium]|nr:DUF1592 domain-containing protein [Acidimicrobiia bacterium]
MAWSFRKLGWFGVAACAWPLVSVAAAAAQAGSGTAAGDAEPPAARYRAVLEQYCVTCHDDRLRTASLSLQHVELADPVAHGDVLEKIVRKLRTGEMPPPGARRPDAATYDAFAGWLEQQLDAEAAARPTPGRPALHRMNRTEYANAVRDLLGLDVDVTGLLPQDDSTHGFDNVADTLGVSPLLLEQYVNAARKVSRLAVGTADVPTAAATYRLSSDLEQTDRFDGLPFGTRGGVRVEHLFPRDGHYDIRVRLARNVNEVVIGMQEEHEIEIGLDGARLKLAAVGGGKYAKASGLDAAAVTVDADDHLIVRHRVAAGRRAVSATFIRKTGALAEGGGFGGGVPLVGSLVITGPFDAPTGPPEADTASRRRIFTCRPAQAAGEPACARQILSTLARRAYRRPVTNTDISVLLDFYEDGRRDGSFDDGIELALRRMLASPQFVFRFEQAVEAGRVAPLSDLELASRLSFFLWSSIPDDELLAAAERGALGRPGELERQMRRMLADPKAEALVTSFAGQWLYLRNLRNASPNPRIYPDFDHNLRDAFRQETELLFGSLIREDRSVLDLLAADYTFVNERLARHYGIPGITGDHFRRVAVTDPRRRGLLGHGSILTVTSYGTRTSPVTRGKWILENLLASPPPPPPADVPELTENDPDAEVLSMRERMAAHRANVVCASCHTKIDPLGLSLENFDAVGRWREVDAGVAIDAAGALHRTEGGAAIDARGALPNGRSFEGPEGLREALLSQPDVFVRAMTEKMLIYALGRGLEHTDAPAIRAIERAAAESDYRFSALVMGIVNSVPFRMIGG